MRDYKFGAMRTCCSKNRRVKTIMTEWATGWVPRIMTVQRGASIELCKTVGIETAVVCHGILEMKREGAARGKRKRDGITYHSCKDSSVLKRIGEH